MTAGTPLVAFDATPLQERKSGIGIYTQNLVSALRDSGGCRILLLSNRAPSAESGLGEIPCDRGGRFPVRAVWMQAILPRTLARIRPSLCHFPNYLAPLRAPCPRVVTLHDMSLYRYPEFFTFRKRYLSRRLLPQVARRAEGIITVSEYSRREIVELLGVPRRQVHVIYEAAPSSYRPVTDAVARETIRRRYGLPHRFILFVGALEPRKNLDRLLAAFAALSAGGGLFADVRLVITGPPGWKNQSLRGRLAELRARGCLLELGYCPQENLPAVYSLATVVAYPSLYEGFGLPIVEAMACGTPVLTSNRASMAEIAAGAAWLVDPEDVESIRRGLETVLRHRDLAAELSARGRERAARFSWSEAAGRTLDVYREVLRAARLPRGLPKDSRGESIRPIAETGSPPVEPLETDVHARALAAHPATSADTDDRSLIDQAAAARRTTADRADLPHRILLRESILRTVIYADLFDSPIGVESLHRFLIGCRAGLDEVERCLDEDPWMRARAIRLDGEVVLRGREGLLATGREQRTLARDLIDQHRGVLRLLSAVPFLRLLAFSGGTSHENSPNHPDLDLFIITAPGRIWTVYGLVVLLARLCRRRKTICANYLIDGNHLRLPRSGDLFTGHELLFVKPLTGKSWARRLMDANGWIYDIFPNAGELGLEHLTAGHPRWQHIGEVVLAPFWLVFERAARGIFRARLRRHIRASALSDVILDDGILKLHIQDRRAPILERFRRRLAEAELLDPTLDPCLRIDRGRAEDDAGAWDAMAAGYDAAEAANPLLRSLRRRFHEEMEDWIAPGERVLDLGCGTGRDTLTLLQRGNDVTAIDLSPEMIRLLREGEAELRLNSRGRLVTRVLSLDQLEILAADSEQEFDQAIADFGTLNCVAHPERFAAALARLVRPGGHLVAAVMNRVCLWEVIYHLVTLRPRAAFRRWGEGPRSANVSGRSVAVWYPNPREFLESFRSEFDLVRLRPHGLFTPPPYLQRLTVRWPGVCRRLEMWENRGLGGRVGARLADHFLIVLRRRGVAPAIDPELLFAATARGPDASETTAAIEPRELSRTETSG